jgi:predicted acylesterase/phospholipase RssA
MESALVRAALASPALVDAHEEAILRTALSLARMYKVQHQGRDVNVERTLEPFRRELKWRLEPVLLPKSGRIERVHVRPHLLDLKERTIAARDALAAHVNDRLPFEAIDRELRHKALVVVLGGGGATTYVHLGALQLLEEYGLTPSLITATSMGAILGLFRARRNRFDPEEVLSIIRSLTWGKLFRAMTPENRYGIPAPLRLYLRSGLSRWFGVNSDRQETPRLKDLPVKMIVSVCGIRSGKLPHPLEFYERLIRAPKGFLLNPLSLPRWFAALAEFTMRPDVVVPMYLGSDPDSSEFDAIDAAGFSSALPGVIHYDVLREEPRTHRVIKTVLEAHGASRFVDGGLTDNVPAQAAWNAVHKGQLTTRNALVLALNPFAMRLSTPLWLPLQRLAEWNVAKNRRAAQVMVDFTDSPSPLAIVPSLDQILGAITTGRQTLSKEMPLVTRLLAPLPHLS